MNSRQDFDESGLARAIVADHRDNLAGMHVQIDIRKRRDSSELLANIAQPQNRPSSCRAVCGAFAHPESPVRRPGRKIPARFELE
jgi:hypothetical protein